MNADQYDDLARVRLSRPAELPGGMSRRRFLQLAGAGAGVVTAGSLFPGLDAFAAPPVGADDGIVVLIMMEGGNDGLNMVVPTGESRYYSLRPNLAIAPATALSVGAGVGLHPSLPKLQARFTQGDVAIVQGVGYGPPSRVRLPVGSAAISTDCPTPPRRASTEWSWVPRCRCT